MKEILVWIDISTIIIFTIECLMKNIAFGFIFNGERSYLRGIWNILDFVILIFSFICLSSLADTFKVVKTFRILRSLRLISKNEGLKVAVRALLFAIPNILNITVIMILFFFIFGIICMSYFKGKMYSCSNALSELTVTTKWDCLNSGGLWMNKIYNFDSLPSTLINLFVMSTTAGWSETMMYTIVTTQID